MSAYDHRRRLSATLEVNIRKLRAAVFDDHDEDDVGLIPEHPLNM